MKTDEFQELLHKKGKALYRAMPWREDTRPYYVLVSELMLQQTQVDRVTPKFESFIARFPNEKTLADAPLAEVLRLWSGLGYNRRAKFLHDAAKYITYELHGIFPHTHEALLRLPGVGPGTAGALLAYAFNQPAVFIETNIRTVYFYHFFPYGDKVTDSELLPLVESTLDKKHPRKFYWALMDYGSWLKKQGVGSIAMSHHYKKQSALKGSVREVRGQIIRLLSAKDMTKEQLFTLFGNDDRFAVALEGLTRDGLISKTNQHFHLTK